MNATLYDPYDVAFGAQPRLVCAGCGQADLDEAEKLLLANGYTIIPPAKPLTFEDVEPMTEVPPKGTEYWIIDTTTPEGVLSTWCRMAYLDKEHALVAARHIFGLKGGEL